MKTIQFNCGHSKDFDAHFADWIIRNGKTSLCDVCFAKLINIHRWGCWSKEDQNNLAPLGGKVVVYGADKKAIELIKRTIHRGRRHDWIWYRKEKHNVFHGSRYKTIHLGAP